MLARFLIILPLLYISSYANTEETAWNRRIPERDQKTPILAPPQNKQPTTSQKTASSRPSSHLEVGASYTYVSMDAAGKSLHGNLGGFQGSYEYLVINQIYGGASFTFRDGSVSSGNISRTILDCDLQERLGYTFGGAQKSWAISLFSGFGYRYLGENASYSSRSISMSYNNFYLPFGLLAKGKLSKISSMGLNIQWRPQVFPTVTIDPLKGARWITDCKIGNFLFELPVFVQVLNSPLLTIVIKPFAEYWQDGHTTAKTATKLALNIPSNHYWFLGCDLSLKYSF